MEVSRIRTAVMGLDEMGRAFLDQLLELPQHYEVVAIADTDAETAQGVGRRKGLDWFDDYRQLVIQSRIDLLVVAAPNFSCVEHIHVSMKKGAHVLKLPPAGRSFDETMGLLDGAIEAGVVFTTARWWRFSGAFAAMRRYMAENSQENYYLVEARVTSAPADTHGWMNDPQLAGGGTLMYLAYPVIDQMLAALSLPQQVYGMCTNRAPDRTQRRLLSEETAVGSMRFTDQLLGNLVASSAAWPGGWRISAFGRGGQISIDGDGFTARDGEGNVVAEAPSLANRQIMIAQMLQDFHGRLLEKDRTWIGDDTSDLLNNMAFIQALYLSEKTGVPEEPLRILKMVNGVRPNPA